MRAEESRPADAFRAVPGLSTARVAMASGLLLVAALLVALAGAGGAGAVCATWALYSVPGWRILRWTALPLVERLALASVTGIAASFTAVLVLSRLLGRFSATGVLAGIFLAFCASLLPPLAEGGREASPRPSVHPPLGPWPLLLLVVLLLVGFGLPYLAVGATVPEGRAFRPFFNADFFKHVALVRSLETGPIPIVDPWSCRGAYHGYWFAYLLPATARRIAGGALDAVAAVLGMGVLQNLCLLLLVLGTARRLGARPRSLLLVAFLVVFSVSFDGSIDLVARSLWPSWASGDVNPEGLDLTAFFLVPENLSASSLQRLCLYVQQHELVLLFFLAWAFLFLMRGEDGPHGDVERRGPSGMVLFLMLAPWLGTSFLLGTFALLVVLGAHFREAIVRRRWTSFAGVLLAAGASLALCIWFGQLNGAGAHFAPSAPPVASVSEAGTAEITSAPASGRLTPMGAVAWLPLTMLSSFGALLLSGLLGLRARLGREGPSRASVLCALALAVPVVAFVTGRLFVGRDLRVEVDLKASYLFALGLVWASTSFFDDWRFAGAGGRRRLAQAIFVLLLLVGLPTGPVDVAWHCRLAGRCTVVVPEQELALLRWIDGNLPPAAVVQSFPHDHFVRGGPGLWVPVFAGRPMAACPRGGNLDETLVADVLELFRSSSGPRIAEIARTHGMGHLYLHRAQGEAGFERMRRVLASSPALFRLLRRVDGAEIWRVEGVPVLPTRDGRHPPGRWPAARPVREGLRYEQGGAGEGPAKRVTS